MSTFGSQGSTTINLRMSYYLELVGGAGTTGSGSAGGAAGGTTGSGTGSTRGNSRHKSYNTSSHHPPLAQQELVDP